MTVVEAPPTGEIRVMGGSGDTRITWNARDTDEVESAQRTFNELKAKGFQAWDVSEGTGDKSERVTEFDPGAQKLIMAPPIAGG